MVYSSMILRRLGKSLTEQNWTAIAIEFVLLVAGVFFGTQVSNWNEARHETNRALANIERIQTDLATDIVALERRKVFWSLVVDNGHDAIRYAETGELVRGSAWKTLLAFYQASQLFPYVPADTTYQELRSAGELGLFKDPDLRAALAAYYVNGAGYAANFLFRLEPEYRKLVRGHTPSIASAQVWAKCHKTNFFDDQFLMDCDSPMPESDAQAVLDEYLADPRLLPELRFWITNLEVMTSMIDQHQITARQLAERLRKESGS
jgi:hypothetical protein